jgi:hypothetical protein
MVTRIFALALVLAVPAAAYGAEDGQPEVHHAPPIARPADEPMELAAHIERADLVKRAVVVYRHGLELREVAFARSATGGAPYVAIVPAVDVGPPGLAYTIEVERTDGARVPAFATRDTMHVVRVNEDVTDAREREQLAALAGRRSVVSASGEYVYFGKADAQVQRDPSAPLEARSFRDAYYRLEGAYTYRILRTVAEFGLRGGVVRGTSVVPGETDPSKFDVGLNYGAPRVRLRALDWLHVEGEFLTSLTEVGFSVGGGGALILGEPYGSRLVLGGESIQVFGSRGYARFDVVTRRWGIAPIVEVSDMPHASRPGVRLLGEVALDIGGGFGIAARGGYQARAFAGGGPSAGLTALYAF